MAGRERYPSDRLHSTEGMHAGTAATRVLHCSSASDSCRGGRERTTMVFHNLVPTNAIVNKHLLRQVPAYPV